LWRDFKNRNFERPYNHGVVGPQWRVPVQEEDNGFKHIASPMPKPEAVRRILPSNLPPITLSSSSFDMPFRKDVIQSDIPSATIRTIEENIDPRFPPKKLVEKFSGNFYHGTGSVDPRVVHGLPSFLEAKKHKKHLKKNSHDFNKQVHNDRSEALSYANSAKIKIDRMIQSITNNPAENSQMILGVDLLNRYEQPDVRLHENNHAHNEGIAKMRNTPAGVRAAHVFRKLP